MLIFTLRRLNLLIFTLLILSLLAYWLEYRLGDGDQSLWVGYIQFLQRLLSGDLGISSQSGRPILETIMLYLPATLELCLAAAIIAIVVGVLLGTLAALNQGKTIDIGSVRQLGAVFHGDSAGDVSLDCRKAVLFRPPMMFGVLGLLEQKIPSADQLLDGVAAPVDLQ